MRPRNKGLIAFTLALSIAAVASTLLTGLPRLHAQGAGVAPVDTEHLRGVAVSGHDPVAYFTKARPVPGKPTIAAQHRGAEWRFSSEANRTAFLADPEKFAPQFGGYCSWAVAGGYTAPGDPTAWRIENGKLYLNYNKEIQARWEQDIPGHIVRGNQNWPTILGKK